MNILSRTTLRINVDILTLTVSGRLSSVIKKHLESGFGGDLGASTIKDIEKLSETL